MFKETAEDVAVKDRLWSATEAEAMRFANRCAEEHVVGAAYSDGQKDVTEAAHKKGYPKGLIRKLATHIRADREEDRTALLEEYRNSIGLNVGVASHA